MQKYTVHLDKNNYFSVDSKIIEFKEETVRIVNLRSISGFIGENFNLSDIKLKDIIHKYLRFSNNVELLNIYSRKYNQYNWFEIYTNQESSEKQVENDHGRIRPCAKLNENYELSEYIKISDEIDSSKINLELKDSKGELIPSKLYENMNKNLPKFQKLDIESINFIPVWYVNGSLQSRADYTELFTTFEILIHILSKRFISFESEILNISSTEIQNGTARGYETTDYSQIKKKALKDLLLQKDERINELQKSVNEMMNEIKGLRTDISNKSEIIINQNNEIKDLQLNVDKKSEIIINQNNEIKDLQIDLNHKSLLIQKSISSLNKTAQEAIKFKQASDQYAINKLSDNKISTGNTDERFILLFRSDLNNNYHIANPKEPKEIIVLDTISCQKENREKLLYIDHNYDEKTCKIIYETSMGNALDFNRFVKNNAEIIQPIINSKENPKQIRKYRIHVSNLKFLISELEKINVDSKVVRDEIINNNHAFMENIYNPIEDVYELLKESETDHVDDLKDILMIMNNEIKNIKNNNEIMLQEMRNNNENINQRLDQIEDKLDQIMKNPVTDELLKKIFKGATINSINFRRRHREIEQQEDGTYIFYTRIQNGKLVDPHVLTVEDLMNCFFKDSSGKVYSPSESRRKQIEDYYL